MAKVRKLNQSLDCETDNRRIQLEQAREKARELSLADLRRRRRR